MPSRWTEIKSTLRLWVEKVKNERLPEAILVSVLWPSIATATVLYFIYYMPDVNDTKTEPGFGLAMVSATIGGLLLASGIIEETKPGQTTSRLKYVGKLFLIASVFSTLFVLFAVPLSSLKEPISGGGYFIIALALLSLFIAVFAFAYAMAMLIPLLWRLK